MKTLAYAVLVATAFFTAAPTAIAHERHTPVATLQFANYVPPAKSGRTRQGVYLISDDRGGDLITYAQRVKRVRSESKLVAFNGTCSSACTLYLSLSPTRICIMPGASFQFHRAYGASREMNQWGSDYLIRQYPKWVQTWIAQRGGLRSGLMRMKYSYASQFLRTCRVATT